MIRRLLAVTALVALGLVMLSCGSAARATFIPDGGAYAAEDLSTLLEEADLSAFADIESERATEVRTEVLASLRREGEDAAALADTLTSDFPTDVTSVPAVVERATYEGTPVWIVIESWGEPGETLSHRRIWVFSLGELAVMAATSAP